MRIVLRVLLGVLGLALAGSLLLSAPAGAAPGTPNVPQPQSQGPAAVTLSATQWKAAGYVTKARNQAVSAGGSSMDYRKMIKIFKSAGKYSTDWRRQMGAAFRQAGGKINHISEAESKAVEKRRKQMYGKRKPLKLAASVSSARSMSPMKDSACKGKSGTVVVNSKETHKYYNSCETINLKYYWGGCIGAMTFIGRWTKKTPKIDLARYFIAAACGFGLGIIQRASDKSDIGAIYLRTYKQQSYQGYTGTQYYITYDLRPQ